MLEESRRRQSAAIYGKGIVSLTNRITNPRIGFEHVAHVKTNAREASV